MRARILIVDDHEVLREGLKALLSRSRPEWKICGEAIDGKQAIQLTQELKPDLIILDISMPGMSGLEACSQMRHMGIAIPVLIFTTHSSGVLAAEVRDAGAQGYVVKSQAAHSLMVAIETILAGGTFFGSTEKPEKTPSATKDKPNPGIVRCQGFAFAT